MAGYQLELKFSTRMSTDEYRREELIREIERRVESMTLRQLEALQYELETKDYSADDAG